MCFSHKFSKFCDLYLANNTGCYWSFKNCKPKVITRSFARMSFSHPCKEWVASRIRKILFLNILLNICTLAIIATFNKRNITLFLHFPSLYFPSFNFPPYISPCLSFFTLPPTCPPFQTSTLFLMYLV